MIKITDQYLWNLVLLAFLGFLLIMATIILETESRIPLSELSLFDLAVIILAAWRLQRFFAYDDTTKFIREQFYDLKKTTKSYSLERPIAGPRRTILDIILNPWSFGLGITALVTFCYLLSAYAVYPLLLLALAGVVSILELGTQYLTNKAEAE